MAGLYIHIPYCRKACIYCNFHFSIQHRGKAEMVNAILKEMELKKDFFSGAPLESIYFGGGTPSVLDTEEVDRILSKAHSLFEVNKQAEVTLEANPEDITPAVVESWKASGINRLSIGIQSLADNELQVMNRNHNAEKAKASVDIALNTGIASVNVDLIFGSPWISDEQWQNHMDWAFSCGADHISAYALTVEPKTLLKKKIDKELLPDTDDQKQARHYEMLYHRAAQQDWDFYEISNLSKPGKRAVHNGNYWKNNPYLGLGPSAHSFSGDVRSWNLADNKKYVEALETGTPHSEREVLTRKNRCNEYLMTHLRMKEGLDFSEMTAMAFPVSADFSDTLEQWKHNGLATETANGIALTLAGRLLCDTLTADLML
jgi:oxygen-independent coproporphyrinogen-3 oxidase